jgi:potassium channel subfamily K
MASCDSLTVPSHRQAWDVKDDAQQAHRQDSLPHDVHFGGTEDATGDPLPLPKSLQSKPTSAVCEALVRHRGIIFSLVLLVAYFLVGIAFYCGHERWEVGDTVYFAVVVMTTVGYGDILPMSDEAKIFTIFYAVFALGLAACAIHRLLQKAAEYASEQVDRIDGEDEDGECLFEEGQHAHKRNVRQLFLKTGIFVVLLIVGMCFFGAIKDWEADDGNRWINGLYLSVITLTTIGFGDFSAATDNEKIFCVCYMLIGIPIFADCLCKFSTLVIGEQKVHKDIKVIETYLNADRIELLDTFCDELCKACKLGERRRGMVDKFEFMTFVLYQNDVVHISQIKDVMANFLKLDSDHSGYVSLQDMQSIGVVDGDARQPQPATSTTPAASRAQPR